MVAVKMDTYFEWIQTVSRAFRITFKIYYVQWVLQLMDVLSIIILIIYHLMSIKKNSEFIAKLGIPYTPLHDKYVIPVVCISTKKLWKFPVVTLHWLYWMPLFHKIPYQKGYLYRRVLKMLDNQNRYSFDWIRECIFYAVNCYSHAQFD